MSFDYENLKRKLNAKYRIEEYVTRMEALKREYQLDEYNSALATLEWVRNESELNDNSQSHAERTEKAITPTANNGVKAVRKRDLVIAILSQLPSEFTRIVIVQKVEEKFPGNDAINKPGFNMRPLLAELVKMKILEIAIPGTSTELTVYRLGEKGKEIVNKEKDSDF